MHLFPAMRAAVLAVYMQAHPFGEIPPPPCPVIDHPNGVINGHRACIGLHVVPGCYRYYCD